MRVPQLASALAFSALTAATGLSLSAQDRVPIRPLTAEDRLAILRRAQVWNPIDTESLDVKAGPSGPGGFGPDQSVTCDYVDRKLRGSTPKFACALSRDDEVKVKFGQKNGEVYGEVAATRLLWALGFGADRMYSVKVICRGCPSKLGGRHGERKGELIFDPAAIERKAAGKTVETRPDEGWSWKELDLVQEAAGGAPSAHRDALKLLAVFMQHGDNKPSQQRLVCLDKEPDKAKETKGKGGTTEQPLKAGKSDSRQRDEAGVGEPEPERGALCLHPFMLINDLGMTFGRDDILNRGDLGSVNLERWAQTPIWKKDERCIGNLPKSLTGSMHDPVISEAGRQFLADLLAKLSDAQIHDLFEVARFTQRTLKEPPMNPEGATTDDWVAAFKTKRDEIATRHCPE